MKWKRDIGLTMRVIMTWALLLLVYLIFLTVLGALFPGIGTVSYTHLTLPTKRIV